MRFTYLLIDLLTMLAPFLLSFHSGFRNYWRSFFSAAIVSAIIFIPWDIYFTHLKVWGFNPTYISGLYLFNLPFEEVLFFFCIPYSCVFTYYLISAAIKNNLSAKTVNLVTLFFIGFFIVLAAMFHAQLYTSYTFALLAGLLAAAQFLFKVNWLFKFYITYAILLLPFLIVNGLLTGTGLHEPIVWYNNSETLGLRILTIPVEDIFYGMDLILLNVLLFNTFNRKFYSQTKLNRVNLKHQVPFIKSH